MFRFLRPYQLVIDAVVAVFFFYGVFTLSTGSSAEYLLAASLAVALLLRRLSPGVALALCWAAACAQMYQAGLQPNLADFAILAVLFSTSAYGGRVIKWLGLASVGLGAILGSTFLVLTGGSYQFGFNLNSDNVNGIAGLTLQLVFLFVAMLVLLGMPWTLGLLVRTRMAARASREAEVAAQLEAERAEQDVIVEQERTRIARDMHDVVAHSLAVVIAQADGARYAREGDPAAVDGALTAISTTARDALADVRLLLGQLRHNQGEGPQPDLEDLERLLTQLRSSGLVIGDSTEGTPLQLGLGPQLAIYRIVQEALTNVLRHGDVTQEVCVRFRWTPTDLEVTITSSLKASAHTAELRLGHGLAGMRERATLAGGRLSAEPIGETFVVAASVPAAGIAVRA
ncbi:MAG: sensor histidine kinase [Glaciihabitans sp.]|nr:sensor histidine kinase [Glaciihabitans sp.]